MINLSSEVISDFKEILEDIGENVTIYRPTKTLSNVGLDAEVSYGSAETIRVVFQLNTLKDFHDKEVVFKMGEATTFALSTNSLTGGTKVVRDNSTYNISEVIPREGVDMCPTYKQR